MKQMTEKLQVSIHPRMAEQVKMIGEAYCHTGTSETLRYLIARGIIEDQKNRSVTDLAEAQKRLVQIFENPDMPLLFNQATDEIKPT